VASGLALLMACSTGSSDDADNSDEVTVTTSAPTSASIAPTTCVPRTDVIVMLNPAVDESAVRAVEDALRDLPGVEEVTFVDQQEALDEFRRLFADNPELAANLQPESLPTSFRVKLEDPSDLEQVQLAAQSLDGVGQVFDPAPPTPGVAVC
jgi:cell division protein FtsX